MKKLMCVALVLVMVLSLAACGKTLKGTYEAELDLLLVKTAVTCEFSGSKVTVTQKASSILGNVETETFEGKYEIAENEDGTLEITFEFENEENLFGNNTYTLEQGEDYVKIGVYTLNLKK
jgi:hypothetical protein